MTEVDPFNLRVGARFVNRAGAIVEITECRNTGLPTFGLDWKPRGNAKLIVCRTVAGNGQYCVFDDGWYHPQFPNQLDLIREVEPA